MKSYEAQFLEESLSQKVSIETFTPRELCLKMLAHFAASTKRYTAYGITTREKNTDQLDKLIDHAYGFTARELDSEIGMYFYRARYYSPEMQRFVSEDTIGFAGGDANLHQYVSSNPLNNIDPTGLLCFSSNLARRKRINGSLSAIKTGISLALGGLVAKTIGGTTIGSALLSRLGVGSILGIAATTGGLKVVAFTTLFNTAAFSSFFYIGREAGNYIGAGIDTFVDDGLGGQYAGSATLGFLSLVADELGFGSGSPNSSPCNGCGR